MSRGLKWGLAASGAVIGLAVVVLLFFDWNAFRPYLEGEASRQSGRTVQIGDISVDLSLTPLITFTSVQIGNVEGGSEDDMLALERLAFRIELLELLQGRMVLPTVEFEAPEVLLERFDAETANWQFGDNPAGLAVSGPAPEDRTEMPVIGALTISNGKLRYRDAVEDLDLTMIVDTAAGSASDSEKAVSLTGEGRIKDSPFTLELTGGSILRLRDPDRPYPVAAEIRVDETEAWLDGTIDRPFDMRGFDMQMRLRGPNAARLFPVLDLALPETPPFDIEGRLRYDGLVWRFEPFAGTMGDSDLSGSLAYDTETERGKLTGELQSEVLDFDDLAGFIGATPDTGAGETASADQTQEAAREDSTERVIPDEPIDIGQLKAMDADVTYSAASVMTDDLPIDRLSAKVLLENGRLRLAPASFGVRSGRVDAFVDLDGTQAVPHIRTRFDIRELPLKETLATFVTDLAEDSATFGAIGGQAELEASGRSLREFMATAGGRIGLATEGGSIGGILVELAGLDAAQALGLVVTDKDESYEVRCIVAAFDIREGEMTPAPLVIDTTDTNIEAEGTISLGKETVDLTFIPHPKDASVFAARAPVHLAGTFKNVSLTPDSGTLAARGIAALALGVLLTPAGAILPFIELGLGEDSDCARLVREAASRQGANEETDRVPEKPSGGEKDAFDELQEPDDPENFGGRR